LEVGAGGGSVARWLCEQVGDEGSVTAVDLEPALLRDQPRPNLEIVQADVTLEPLPGEGYDLVHARMLLMHVPNRDELIGAMLARLRPGGVLVLEEADLYPVLAADCPAYVTVLTDAADMVRDRGGDWQWARHLPARLAASGADRIVADTTVDNYCGGTPQAEFFALTIEQLSPLIVAHGVDAAVIDEAIAALTDSGQWLPGFAVVRATARRPG
jgi:SAM-dependent methyltransferase